MNRPWPLLAGLVVAGALAAPARADVVVRAPFVRVEVGPVVSVWTPYFSIAVPRRVVTRPAVLPAETPPPEPGAPPPVPMLPVPSSPVPPVGAPAARAMTVPEFASAFRPAPGPSTYEVVLTHPCTGCPVKVCFSLPGCPKRVKVTKTTLTFRYGLLKKPVVVTFCRDGGVQVR
jgi:hypothetical protein